MLSGMPRKLGPWTESRVVRRPQFYPATPDDFMSARAWAMENGDTTLLAALGETFDEESAKLRARLPAGRTRHSANDARSRDAPPPQESYFNQVNPDTGVKRAVELGRMGNRRGKSEGGKKSQKVGVKALQVHVVPEGEGVETVCQGCGKSAMLYEKDQPGGIWVAKLHYAAPCNAKFLQVPVDGSKYIPRKLLWQDRHRRERRRARQAAQERLLQRVGDPAGAEASESG